MPLGMIVRRIWRERRLLSVLLLAVCLVTGFFSLGPLYVRAVSEAGIRFAVENAEPQQLNLVFSNLEPFGPEVYDLLNQELGGLASDLQRITRSTRVVPGFGYELGQPVTAFSGRSENNYQMVAFSSLRELFTLSAGRWPVRLSTPAELQALSRGLSADALAANQLGVYSRGQVEAVITRQSAEESGIEIGNRLVIGEEIDATAIVRVVGIVEPVVPAEDPFWEGMRVVLTGEYVPINAFQERYDFALIVPEGAYDDWVAPTTAGNTYEWRLKLSPDVLHADTLDELDARLSRVQNNLRARYPDVVFISGLTDLVTTFRSTLRSTEGPIVLLSGAVLILMLYHLVTTVALVLEQQGTEWASITSRGGSIPQLIEMQLVTMGVLGAIGLVVGPFIAQGILILLEHVGPLARTLNGATLGVRSLPPSIFGLSAAAAVASVAVLTLPAWPAARRSLLRLKQLISRPPTHPAWARYFLDVILLVLGLAFMLRLYFLISGDIGTSLQVLLSDPASLIRLIASGANEAGGLNDPFNLLGPALILTGAALLWLRLFPLLMRLIGRLFSADNGLTLPLAVWSVERDPGHYAQLVLLLIGTLALGTASLALSATRDAGAWTLARSETGGDARLSFDARAGGDESAWRALPGVTGGESLLVAETVHRAGRADTTLFGLDPVSFGQTYPEFAEAVAPLALTPAVALPGLALPEDAVDLSLQVYAEASPDEPTETALAAQLADARGVPVSLALETAAATDSGRFVTYRAALPEVGQAPWRLVGLRVQSRRGELQDFTHTLYLDDLAVVNDAGVETVVEDFESGAEGWMPSSIQFQRPDDLAVGPDATQAASGAGSLSVTYRIRRMGGGVLEPLIGVNEGAAPIVPVVISRRMAESLGDLTSARIPLEAGDEGALELQMPYGNVELRYRVAGIVDSFLTQDERDQFLLVEGQTLRAALNRVSSLTGFYDFNQAWIELDARQPSEDLRFGAAGLPGLIEASYAWDRFNEIQREPLPNSVTGMLFAGFWVSLALSVLDFGFYLAVTARRRAVSFAVLQSMGWESRNIWGQLAVEQAALITPALLVGVALGGALAYLLLPFLELIGGEALRFPLLEVGGLLLALVIAFSLLLAVTAVFLRRRQVHQVLRMGEE